MITLFERVEMISASKLISEAGGDSILASFFSLVKTNNGKYKSPKQAAFLQSKMDGNLYSVVQTLSFGTSQYSQRKVTWNVVCDDVGVVSIEKVTGSKGREVYWARDDQPGAQDSIAAKKAVQQNKNRTIIQQDLQNSIDLWTTELNTKQAELDKIRNLIDSPEGASVRDYLSGRIPEYEKTIVQYQEAIARAKESLERSLANS